MGNNQVAAMQQPTVDRVWLSVEVKASSKDRGNLLPFWTSGGECVNKLTRSFRNGAPPHLSRIHGVPPELPGGCGKPLPRLY